MPHTPAPTIQDDSRTLADLRQDLPDARTTHCATILAVLRLRPATPARDVLIRAGKAQMRIATLIELRDPVWSRQGLAIATAERDLHLGIYDRLATA